MGNGSSTQANYLSLDDAALRLNLSRKQLAGFVTALDIRKHQGDKGDRHAYLHTQDIERIQNFRTGESKTNPMFSGSITYSSVPQPQQMDRSYKSFAKEAFRGDPTFFKAASYVITNGAAIPPKLFTDARMKDTIDKHPLLDLLEEPNNEQSGVDYREGIIGYLLIAGNSYQFASRVTRKSGPPDELWTLPPELVHPVLAKPRGITGYKFEAWDDKDNPIAPELIRHDKFWNPTDPTFGLSPIEPIAILIDQNEASRKWNLAVLQNGGRMDGAWVAPMPLGPNERSTLEQKLNGKYRGYANAGKAPVLDAGMVFNPTAYTPTELDWLESIRRNEGGIANGINIPPQLIGDTSATTYNNMGEAKAASYTEEIFPVLDRIYAGWRRWLLPMFGLKGAYLYYDKESVEVVQQVIQAQKEAQFKRAVLGWLQGALTMNEAREIMGLLPVPGGDVFRFGAILVRAAELDKYAEQSLSTPAAPPVPQAEPIQPPPPENNNQQQQTPPKNPKKPARQEQAPEKEKSLPLDAPLRRLMAESKRLMLKTRGTKASSSDVTHLLWECAATPCAFCAVNDNEVVVEGDDFPNGVSSPDDCHKFCQCSATQLALPDDVNPDDLDTDSLVAFYAVGFIAARHDQDVAEQEQRDEEDDDEEDDDKSLIPHDDEGGIRQHQVPAIMSLYDIDKKAYKALLRGKPA